MLLAGRPYEPKSRTEAEGRGVRMVMQELNLIGNLTVAENIFIERLPSRLGFIHYGRLHQAAREAMAKVGLADVDPATPVRALGRRPPADGRDRGGAVPAVPGPGPR